MNAANAVHLEQIMRFPVPDNHCADTIAGQVDAVPKWVRHCVRNRVCVQAGGNIGIYPNVLAEFFDTVYTFEPDKANYDCLVENCSANKNIIPMFAGLGEVAGKSGIHFDPLNIGAHYLENDGDIQIVTIDSVFPDNLCDLIALDVEGYEWQALKGAIKTIESCSPVIVIEMKNHGRRYGYSDDEMSKWLTDLGYRDVEKTYRDHVWVFGG